jgi:hypothetical protein
MSRDKTRNLPVRPQSPRLCFHNQDANHTQDTDECPYAVRMQMLMQCLNAK